MLIYLSGKKESSVKETNVLILKFYHKRTDTSTKN